MGRLIFTTLLPHIRASNKRLSEPSRRRWFETPSRSLWRHCIVLLWYSCSVGMIPCTIYANYRPVSSCLLHLHSSNRMITCVPLKLARRVLKTNHLASCHSKPRTPYVIIGVLYSISFQHKVSNIRRTLVGNKIVDHSDVVGASPVGAAPTTSSLST